MIIFRKISCILILVPFLTFSSGCASYRFGRLPSPYINDHPAPITQKDVSVAVEFLGYSEANYNLDWELKKRKVIAVFIVINNKSTPG